MAFFQKYMKSFIAVAFIIAAIIVVVLLLGGEPEENPIRKTIISHVGEVEKDIRFLGDKVIFKIYYKNTSSKIVNIGIVDKLDPGLDNITVFSTGKYDSNTHAVIWELKNVSAGASGFVSFEAALSKEATIENQAYVMIGIDGLDDLKLSEKEKPVLAIDTLKPLSKEVLRTNTVKVVVHGKPKLGWIPFEKGAKEGKKSTSNMKDETTTDVMINFNIPGMYVNEKMIDGITYHQLSMPFQANKMDIGKPQVPIAGRIIEVPKNVDFSIEIVEKKSINLNYYNVMPVQEPQIRQSSPSYTDKFTINKAAYLRQAEYPGDLAIVRPQDIGIVRGHRIVFLKVNPVQFNPVTKEMTAYSQIEVKLRYSRPAQIEPIDSRIYSNAFEDLLKNSVMNYKDDSRHARGDERHHKEVGCDYLILTHGDFYDPADINNPIVRFAEWKSQKGYITKVVDIADIPAGQDEDDIRDYIDNAYDNWYPVPTYVLLVGDSEFLPTNYQRSDGTDIEHRAVDFYNGANVGTDLYYSTVDGADFFPDIFIGRISVDTLAEAQTVFDKIIDYEKQPPANANYYTDSSLVQLFEDDWAIDGREDGTFRIVEFAEEIRTYLQNNGYTSTRIYDQSGNFANGPQRYEDGTNIPAALTIAGGFPWNGATGDITNEINNGNFLSIYDGHGLRDLWDRPEFDNADVNALANGALTPVVFSLACETGWFDNETDDDVLLSTSAIPSNTGNNAESLSETFLRHNNGGAVGIIGSSRISYEENDFMMLGMVSAVWPDFNPNPPLRGGVMPDHEISVLSRLGQIITFSKIFMANAYDDDQLQFEIYHLFGDPEMPIWTDQPIALDVVYPTGIGSTGEQDFVVRVLDSATGNPVNMAQVTLTQNGAIVETRQTNPDGYARFTMSGVPAGDMTITVVASNYIPFEDKIIVSASGAQINRLDPQDGTENQKVHVGGMDFSGNEEVDIYFGDTNIHTVAATAGSFGQAGVADVDIQVPSPHGLGPVNVLATGRNSNRHGVDVFHVRTANPIDLYTYSQWDDGTWHLHQGNNPTWNNPEIQIYDAATNDPVESNNLVVGQNYRIKIKVHNDTDFDADNVKVTFKWANFGVGQPDRVWENIDTVEVNVASNSVHEAEVLWTPGSTGHLCIKADIYHIEDIVSSNNSGQENCHVGPTASPATVPFEVWNPTKEPAMVFLELRQQPNLGNTQGGNLLWGSHIVHPSPQLIMPDKSSKAEVVIDPDILGGDIRPGEKVEFSLTGFINGKVVGGANFIIIKGK